MVSTVEIKFIPGGKVLDSKDTNLANIKGCSPI